MNKRIILLGIIGIMFLIVGCQKPNYDSFAQCLTEKRAVMYGTYWCGHCKDQKEMFGESFQYINYVECTEKQQTCDDAGITGYPTWIIKGEKYSGVQQFYKLAGLTQCEIEPEM